MRNRNNIKVENTRQRWIVNHITLIFQIGSLLSVVMSEGLLTFECYEFVAANAFPLCAVYRQNDKISFTAAKFAHDELCKTQTIWNDRALLSMRSSVYSTFLWVKCWYWILLIRNFASKYAVFFSWHTGFLVLQELRCVAFIYQLRRCLYITSWLHAHLSKHRLSHY